MKSFSDRCKELFIGAEKLARVSNNLYIYPEHLALTIFSNPSYLIKKILDEVNLDVDDKLKPSRKERSIKAKIKEDEERNSKSNTPDLELTEDDNKIKDVNFLK